MTYQELFKIEYNNKNFMIFLDENNRKTFLEIDKLGDYVYPELEDFIALHKIFNTKEPFICYAPRFKFTEKVRVVKGTVVSLLTLITILNNIPNVYASDINVEIKNESVVISEIVTEKEQAIEKRISIKDTNELEQYLGHLDVTKEMVLKAINENAKLPAKYKKIATNLLNAITENYPNFDLRIFYENIKSMEVFEYTQEQFKQVYPNVKKAGAVYDSQLNRITTIDEVQIELLYHEMFHATHHFYRKIDNTLIFRSEDNTALNEAMTDIGSSLVIPQKEGYVFNKTVLNFLLTTIDYDLEDYSKKGIDYLKDKLQSKYYDIDFNYIMETLNAINTYYIYEGIYTSIDLCPDLRSELFKLCLKNISLENAYASFAKFAQMFYDAKNPELIFTYLEEYNNKLKELSYKNIITKEDAINKFLIYKDVTGIGYDQKGVYPIIADAEKKLKVDTSGNTSEITSISYRNTFNFSSLISSSMFGYYEIFGTPAYWQELGINNGLINPIEIKEIPICYQNKLLTTAYVSDILIQVGLMENKELGFILTNYQTGEILYQSAGNMKYLSNKISLNYYIVRFSNYIDKLDLEDVLNMDYLKIFQRETSQFKNIKNDGDFLFIEPLQEVNIFKDNLLQVCYLNNGKVVINNGIASINNTNISFETSYPLNETIKLQDIFASNGMLDYNVTSYNLTENEIITMIENYLQELNIKKGR